ncbi:hypothetical protein KBC80_03515 [Candidatus Woesebacteria bacterium]|nr:hypothetical protein [Candidatus Woesebacteria bacterium]
MNNNLIIHAIPSELIPLYVLVCGAIVTIWFLNGLLNPFIDAVLAIVKCAIDSILTLFFRPIHKLSDALDKRIRLPIRKFKQRFSFKVVTRIYFTLGILVLYVDHLLATRIFNMDETALYFPMVIYEKTYWVSLYALLASGWLIFAAELRFVGQLFTWFGNLFDKDFQVNILIYK